jgi:putative redox protein
VLSSFGVSKLIMIASVEWKQGTQFIGRTEIGHTIQFDAEAAHTTGPSPMEAVLTALCACTSVDVVSILQKKREPLTSLIVFAEAEQAPAPPRTFTHIRLTYRIGGNVSKKAAEDAVSLSKNKYCSVSKMLEKSATIDYTIEYAAGVAGE